MAEERSNILVPPLGPFAIRFSKLMNEPLLEAALRPFSDNAEMKQAAAAFLESHSHVDPAAADEMVARWNAVDAAKHRAVWRGLLWLAVVVLAAVVATRDFHDLTRVAEWAKSFGSWSGLSQNGLERVANQFSGKEKLLVAGPAEALWQSEPENPAFYADYAASLLHARGTLPPDFLQTAGQIAPTNGWFTDFAAGVASKDAVKAIYTAPKQWEILDQAKLDRALALFHEARTQPEWEDPMGEVLRLRLAILPEDTQLDRIDSLGSLGSSSNGSLNFLSLGKALAAAAWQRSEAHDLAGFETLERDGSRFLDQISASPPGTLLGEMVRAATVKVITESFSAAANSLGLPSANRWKPMFAKFEAWRGRTRSGKLIVDGKEAVNSKAVNGIDYDSLAMLIGHTANQPKLTAEDLKPARLTDHDLISWVLSDALWLGIAFCLGLTALFRFRVPVLTRRLARRMTGLLRPSDWAWIVAAGVVLPIAYVIGINRFTPLGGRQMGVWATGQWLPAVHFAGLWMLWLTVPVQIVRWRMAARARGFGFRGPSRIGWVGIACAAAFVPMSGWAVISPGMLEQDWFFGQEVTKFAELAKLSWMTWAAIGLLAGAFLALVAGISMAIFARSERLLMPAVSARAMVPGFAAMLLLLALSSIAFKAAQQSWFERDTLWKFDHSTPGWSVIEGRIATQLHEELQEIVAGANHPGGK